MRVMRSRAVRNHPESDEPGRAEPTLPENHGRRGQKRRHEEGYMRTAGGAQLRGLKAHNFERGRHKAKV
ncbi:hypothetical protein L484_005543 [Morus notabilis]|uniref:Uncharacterized protein n=1 Tax=Morus notabilis TaxID=981085 RepID=W9QF30_9ROSA|nr:hypothetical protein L484_005543 [Morus notabilis]